MLNELWIRFLSDGPWFSDRRIGNLFLLPVTLKGWICFAVFILVIAATSVSHSDLMWPIRIGTCIAYLGLSYVKSDRWP